MQSIQPCISFRFWEDFRYDYFTKTFLIVPSESRMMLMPF